MARALGIDVGGSGIKTALVDLDSGALVGPSRSIPTPHPASPEPVAEIVGRVVREHDHPEVVGATFPGVVKGGVAHSAANVDKRWIGTDVAALFGREAGCAVAVLNDADAAGLAEVRFGAGRGEPGVVVMLTLGTGIGSALFLDGRLVPNTELGHLELDGHDAETRAAPSVKDREGLTYEQWAARLEHYLRHVERLFTPDLFILGGGVSRDAPEWLPLITLGTPIRPARLRGDAGIVGAAVNAARGRDEPTT